MKIVFLILFSISLCFADDIVLKIGKSLTNVQIIEEDHFNIRIEKSNGKKLLIRKETILKIIKNPFDATKPSVLIEGQLENTNDDTVLPLAQTENQVKYPNLDLWPVSVVSFGLFLGLKIDANNIQSKINEKKNATPFISTAELEDKKRFNNILSIICLVGGIANTIYMVLPAEISATNNKVSLSFKF